MPLKSEAIVIFKFHNVVGVAVENLYHTRVQYFLRNPTVKEFCKSV